GYVAEIMILKYGSFEAVLHAMSNIGEKHNVISIEKPDEYSVKNFKSQLIIIDPIDHKRNLGTAISAESIGKLVLAARSFLAKPSFDFFIKKEKKVVGNYKDLYQNIVMREGTANFILKNQKKSLITWVDREMRVSTLLRRKTTNAEHFLKLLLTKKIESTGITRGLIGDIQRLFRLYSGDDLKIIG